MGNVGLCPVAGAEKVPDGNAFLRCVVAWLSPGHTGRGLAYLLTGEKGYIHLEQGKKTNLFVATSDQVSREMPFHIRLDSFRVAYYPGTEAPMDYLSYVTCWVKGEERKEIISMNHILSVDGYRFYQSSFDTDWSGSWLSVNHDPWGIAVTYAGYVCLLFLQSVC